MIDCWLVNVAINSLPSLARCLQGLSQNTSLTELNLARCSIGDDGCKALCAEIKFLPNLQLLNLTLEFGPRVGVFHWAEQW